MGNRSHDMSDSSTLLEHVYGIAPTWRIKPERGRVIVYKHSTDEVQWNWIPFPIGLAFALMDGCRTGSDVAHTIADLADVSFDAAASMVLTAIDIGTDDKNDWLLIAPTGDQQVTRTNLKRFLEMHHPDDDPIGESWHRLQAPLSLLLMPTNRCDTDCVYCYAERRHVPPQDELPLERWLALIDEAARIGVDSVTFSGGDPLCYPGIWKLMERLASWKLEFLVSTKAPVSTQHARRLAELTAEVGTVQVSVDAADPQILDRLLQRRGYGVKIWESLANLIEAKVRLRTQSIITPVNLGDVPELIRRLYAVGVRDGNITSYSRSFYIHDDALFLTEEEIAHLADIVSRESQDIGWHTLTCGAGYNNPGESTPDERKRAWEARAGCSGGNCAMCITPTGDVTLCEQLPQEPPFVVGSTKQSGLMDIWRSDRITEFVNPERSLFAGTECERCPDFEPCHVVYGRCFRDSYFLGGGLYAPPPSCPRTTPGPRIG